MKPLWPRWYRPRRRVSAFELIDAAAIHAGVYPAEITGKRRNQHLVRARSAIAIVLREQGLSYPRIGKALGGRDHTTVINLVNMYPFKCRDKDAHHAILSHLRNEVAA